MDETMPIPNSEPIKTNIKVARITKNHIIFILLILSISLNAFFIINNGKITGAAVNDFRYIRSQVNIPIDSEEQNGEFIIHYKGLREELEKKILEYGELDNIGLFIQDVKTGAWTGIKEKTFFIPASLFKVPIMMAILKKVDMGEMTLTDKIILMPQDLNNASGNLYKLGAGAAVPINELLKEMITFSDNTAKNALERQLSVEEIDSVFSHVGIAPYSDSVFNRLVTPRGYTRFFKSLYYSSYLSPELSEFAIELMTETQEENLIPKGVPYEIQVAHKFGYYNQNEEEGIRDCGIVYHPKNPYFLCIMTKSLETDKALELIPELSKEVFEYIDSK